MSINKNKLYIIGVGPGNIDLLTLKAYKIITSYPEIALYDRLIPDEIIDLLPKNCEKIFAGKQKKCHYMTQSNINENLVKYYNQGKKVVRLKGGDPFIFGRGGEEILHLQQNNITNIEIIPGITTASNIAAEFKLPLTQREIVNELVFLTGHAIDNGNINYNWQDLVSPQKTLIIYMGLSKIEYICKKLTDSGMKENRKAMAVQWSGIEKNKDGKIRKVIYSDIKNLSKDLKNNGFISPTTIIISELTDISQLFN